MESVRIWLKGNKDYSTGAKLYQLYGKDLRLKSLFKLPENIFRKNMLLQELQKLCPDVKAIKPASLPIKKPVEPAKKRPEPKKEYVWSDKPDAVEQSIYSRWKPLFLEMMDLVSRVGDIAKQGEKDPAKELEAGRMVHRILDLDDELEELYAERQFYLDNGKEKVKFPYGDPCIDPILIPQKLQNHQRYLREQKRKLEKDPSSTEAALLMKKHQWFVDHYSKILKK